MKALTIPFTCLTATFAALFCVSVATSKNHKDKKLLQILEDSLNQYFIDTWPFKKRFPIFGDLQIDMEDVGEGLDVEGGWTKHTFRQILKKAIRGEIVNVVILGSSVTVGAELGCRNYRRTFHYGFSYWWNKTIGAVTDSKLSLDTIAVGGSGTAYFAHCWREYLKENQEIDLVLWELALNDNMEKSYSGSFERLIRSVVEYKSRPGLLLINFFRKNFFTDYLIRSPPMPCQRHEIHETIIRNLAIYYAVTSLSLERTICNKVSSNRTALTMRDLFNGKHPSSLAHAQMTFILTFYVRKVLIAHIAEFKDEASKKNLSAIVQEKEPSLTLPEPISLKGNDVIIKSICWTEVFVDYRKKLKHPLFSLPVIENKGFSKMIKTDWKDADEKRYDSVGGYLAFKKGRLLGLELNVSKPPSERNVTISAAVRNKYFGGKVKFAIYDAVTTVRIVKLYINSADKDMTGLNVFELTTVPPGKYVLVVKTITGGVLLSSIILT